MEYRSGQSRVSLAAVEYLDKMLRIAGASGGNYRNLHGGADGRSQLAIEARASAVPVHRGKQDLSSAALLGFHGPLHGGASGRDPAPGDVNVITMSIGSQARVDGNDYRLRSKTRRDALDERGVFQRCRINADFVRAGFEDRFGVFELANAAAHGEGNEQFARRAPNRAEQCPAVFVSRRNFEQNDFIR